MLNSVPTTGIVSCYNSRFLWKAMDSRSKKRPLRKVSYSKIYIPLFCNIGTQKRRKSSERTFTM